jgi:penicillin-binding protein 2
VDVRGRELATEGQPAKALRKEPVPGLDLRMSLDMDMMRSAERAFRGHPSGGLVVVDIHTGRVRALYSKPGYDLNEWASGLSEARQRELLADPYRPLTDKTMYESYFPGSTFKPISALAALQDNVLPGSTHYECPGFYMLGKRRFRCSHVHGDVDMHDALVQSCNVYFYRLAEQVGIDRIANYAHEFGLGQPTGIGINAEASGFVPTRDWYANTHEGHFHMGFSLNTAIGQGDTRVTLIQLAMVYAALANGGTLYIPQLVEKVEQADGRVVQEFPPRIRRKIDVDPAYLTYVREGLYGVVNHRKGTAYDAHIEGGIAVAGKTGTADVVTHKAKDEPPTTVRDLRPHSWFAAFAPYDNPELAIVVLVEHGGAGGRFAAPIALQVLQDALGDDPNWRTRPVLLSKKP